MQSDQALPPTHPVHQRFGQLLNLEHWRAAYAEYYWLRLAEDDAAMRHWQHPLYWRALLAARRFNEQYAALGQVFCWLDVDRSQDANAGFQWESSPVSGEPLTDLGPDFHPKYRLVSWADALVMPHHRLREWARPGRCGWPGVALSA
ncbi:hypothetical protein EJV47_08640 [Hymenobacter gummosus]|uniref:Uncharacterized protein n=1 Tax=Hymenobacter gummosus TaxID=1776032 RepID=A0A3S0JF21_9BACT|nr:hypothetical protein [Hymenobacter gummosus]RTQ50690.1 hypothetical protein EJV47_08640 [Hymenobacter gummosus]